MLWAAHRAARLAIIPVALFNQNFSVAKALFADYVAEAGGSDADRAGAVGQLGMAVGLSFMAGPLLATLLVSDYKQAVALSAALTAASGGFILLLPKPKLNSAAAAASAAAPADGAVVAAAASDGGKGAAKGSGGGLMAFMQLPVLRTPGAQLLMAMRLLMALAFHMFMPVWQVSLKVSTIIAIANRLHSSRSRSRMLPHSWWKQNESRDEVIRGSLPARSALPLVALFTAAG